MISLTNITKSYGGTYALMNINLNILKGEFVVLFGPNGAGKSTLLKVVSTLLKPTEGKIEISDNVPNNKQLRRNHIGLVSHECYLYENLTAYENLVFFAKLHGLKNPYEKAFNLLEKMQIENRAHDLVKNYSHGMKQRIALCRAIIHNPQLLILDEPFNSLDLAGISIMTSLLKDLKSDGKTIFMSTHNHELTMELANRILVLVNGKLILNTTSPISRDKLHEIYVQ